ncbi:50S ribosomal protein L10 [Buchnera aphidicola (Neophyllaphis varicolor)]|uniref:50S ribosomal protein L10 n=1 Tax=Buchnera aphidicola TaxID=9 RepID=UPI0031B83084
MALNLQNKKDIIYKTIEISKSAISAIIADPSRITANEITKLRKKAREKNVIINIIKNTLLRKIIKKTNFKCLKNILKGQNIIAYSIDNPGSAVKLFKEFSKKNKNFQIKGAAFEGKLLSLSQIDYLANIPTIKEALTKLVITLKIASIGKLVYIIYNVCKIKEKNKT